MANNETSGISVLTYLAKWIKSKKRNFSYRIIFVPETVGSIAYIKKNFINVSYLYFFIIYDLRSLKEINTSVEQE